MSLTIEEYESLIKEHGSIGAVSRATGRDERNLRRWIKRNIKCEEDFNFLEHWQAQQGETEPEAEPEVIKPRDYLVPSENHVDHKSNSTRLKIGIISDTHLCSKQQQLTYLNDYYRWAYDQGVRDVYHAGDMIAGVDVYPGQSNDLLCHNEDEQIDYAVEHYPKIDGVTTHVISGNHDLVFIKRRGGDPLRSIAMQRPDINYLGQFSAWIQLQDNCSMYLLHPDGGSAYAISYKMQKLIESFEGGKKPNVAVMGHYHRRGYFPERNVHGFLGACFESQTDFLRRKAISPVVGGLVLELEYTNSGGIHEIVPRFKQYMVPIEKDWGR